MKELKQLVNQLNLFPSSSQNVDTNAYELHLQIISTRVYLVLLIVSIFVLVISIWQKSVTKTMATDFPSYEKYSIMYDQYPEFLSCPCTTISIPYGQFIIVQAARFHQLCQSIYIASNWGNLIDMSFFNTSGFENDFREIGNSMFKMSGSFCNQTYTAIVDGLVIFNQKLFVTDRVMPLDEFNTRTQSEMDLFIISAKSAFKNSLEIRRQMTHGNVLLSAIVGNFQLNFTITNSSRVLVNTQYITVNSDSYNCSCQQNTSCTVPAKIFTDRRSGPIPIVRFVIPGMVLACYVIDSVFQSNLVCFYNQSCIDDLIAVLESPVVLNTTALDITIPSQYKPDSTLGDIIEQLMVEEWIKESSHKAYYAQCNPTACTASYNDNNDFVVVFSSAIGIIGTLPAILHFIVPRVVKKLWSCCKHHHSSHSNAKIHPSA